MTLKALVPTRSVYLVPTLGVGTQVLPLRGEAYWKLYDTVAGLLPGRARSSEETLEKRRELALTNLPGCADLFKTAIIQAKRS